MKKATPFLLARVRQFVERVAGEDMHSRRALSLGNAVVGCLYSSALAIHAIGLGLAKAEGLNSKHAIKQVDRLVSNAGIRIWDLFKFWVPFIVASRPHIIVALDWTDFEADDQSTIALNMITSHGRATPLLWKTVKKSELKNQRNSHEDELLVRLKETLPNGVSATILADRGFGDTKLYAFLKDLGLGFVIRFKENILVTNEKGESRRAVDWLTPGGRAKKFEGASVTAENVAVPAVVVTKAAGMKEAWCLVCSEARMPARLIVDHYSKRFSIEENFRDSKDIHFGMGLSHTRISTPERRDRVLLISALAIVFMTLLGSAGEATGLDTKFRANTVKRRTHSLFRQGCMYYDCLPTMREEWARPLMMEFEHLLSLYHLSEEIFGIV